MKRILACLLSCLLLCGDAVAEGFRPTGDVSVMASPAAWGEWNTHDPSIIKAEDGYYVFSTDASYGDIHQCGIQIRYSTDLVHWEHVGVAFSDYITQCEAAGHAKLDASKKQGLWAPDIVYANGRWRLYYSASTFGSSRSAIGMAEAEDIRGPYEDRGIVIKSQSGALNGANCIDPAFITDRDGKQWMCYGSFFGGIFIVPLGEDGFIEKGADPVRIAGTRSSAIEGSYIVYAPEVDWYYLFVSYGSLSSDYNIRVARSREVTGPYVDCEGNDMVTYATINAERVGTKLMGGFAWEIGTPKTGVMAPGHCSVLMDEGRMYLVHHARTQQLPDYWFRMEIRPMVLNAEAWPVVLPMRYQGESFDVAEELPDGRYALLLHGRDSNKAPHVPVEVTLEDGSLTGGAVGSATLTPDGLTLTLADVPYQGTAMWQTDEQSGTPVLCLSAMNAAGECLWMWQLTE